MGRRRTYFSVEKMKFDWREHIERIVAFQDYNFADLLQKFLLFFCLHIVFSQLLAHMLKFPHFFCCRERRESRPVEMLGGGSTVNILAGFHSPGGVEKISFSLKT